MSLSFNLSTKPDKKLPGNVGGANNARFNGVM
jgi:hypothetical protein